MWDRVDAPVAMGFHGEHDPVVQQIRATGAVREPYPRSASAPIAMDDIAAVAATVLLEDSHSGQAYTLTGPETLTRVELARQLGDAIGRFRGGAPPGTRTPNPLVKSGIGGVPGYATGCRSMTFLPVSVIINPALRAERCRPMPVLFRTAEHTRSTHLRAVCDHRW